MIAMVRLEMRYGLSSKRGGRMGNLRMCPGVVHVVLGTTWLYV